MSDSSEGRRTKDPSWAASWLSMDGRPLDSTCGARGRLVERRLEALRARVDRRGGNAGAGNADDVGFDHHVVGTADEQQVLDIVPAEQKELPLPVEIIHVDDAEPGLAAAAARSLPGIIRRPPVSLRKTRPKSTSRTRMIAKAIAN